MSHFPTDVGSSEAVDRPDRVSLAERVLLFARGPRAEESEANLHACLWILLVHVASERGASAVFYTAVPGVGVAWSLFAVAMALACAAALALSGSPRWTRAATMLAFVAYLAFDVAGFPENANHGLIVLLLLSLFAFFDTRSPEERRLLVGSCCWVLALVLFATGLQKFLHGTYFHGEYLAVHVAASDTFASVFQFVLPADEFQRLRGYGFNPDASGLSLFLGHRGGSLLPAGVGPIRFESTAGLLISNAIWIAELLTPLALLWPRTRRFAALLALGLIFAIEVGAREYFFGLLFVNALLFFFPGELHRRLRPAFGVAYVLLLLNRVAVVSDWVAS